MNGDGKFDKGRYTTIPETKNVKLPIGGKIRLGIKVKNEEGVEHPKELQYFVCPQEVMDVYGEEPTELTVFFPVAEREKVFPQSYEKYGSNEALLCQGDGDVSKTAQRLNLENGRWEEVKCPCEHFGKYDKKTKIGGCGKVGYLKFMMPSVSIGTFYQCRVGGTVSIEECNSAFELANKTTGGCWAMIPFRMRRVLKKLKIPGTAKMKDHWVVTLEVAASVEEIKRVSMGEILYLGQKKNGQYELEAPELPLMNKVYVAEDTEEEIKLREKKAIELQETLLRDLEATKTREAELKKQIEEGKSFIKTPAEIKRSLEKRNAILEEIQDIANKNGLNNWRDIIDLGVRYKIFFNGIVASQAKTYVVDHSDKREELIKAIKEDQEITEADIPPDDREPLEVIDEEAPYPDEKEGSSYDNPIKTNLKRKTISKAEDFLAPGDMPD